MMNIRKISNDNFEPKYKYDKIELIDSIIIKYKNVDIEFIKKTNKNIKFNIRLSFNNSNIKNLKEIINLFIDNQ